MGNPLGHHGPLDERQRAVHLTHLRTMLGQCRNAARNLPHKPSREAAERNAETLDWALAQLEQPQPKARRRSVVEPPPDDIWPTGGAA